MNTVHPQKVQNNFSHSPNYNNQFYSPSRNQNSQAGRPVAPFYSPNRNSQGGRSSNFNPHRVPIKGIHFSNSNGNMSANQNFRDVGYRFNDPMGYKENQNRAMIFNDPNNNNTNDNYNQSDQQSTSNYLTPTSTHGVVSPLFRPVVTEKERVERTLRSAQGVLTNRQDSTMNSLRDSKYMKKNFGVKASYHQK